MTEVLLPPKPEIGNESDSCTAEEKSAPSQYWTLLRSCLEVLFLNLKVSDTRPVALMLRKFPTLRKCIEHHVLHSVVDQLYPESQTYCFAAYRQSVLEGTAQLLPITEPSQGKHLSEKKDFRIPELPALESSRTNAQTFIALLVLVRFLDTRNYNPAVKLADAIVDFISNAPSGSLDDLLSAKVYFYYSRVYELAGNYDDIRRVLLEAYPKAVSQKKSTTQTVILNALLRNYIHFGDYTLALRLAAKVNIPENLRSNAQQCRYLYYIGRMQAAQLDYSAAHTALTQALNKATQGASKERVKSSLEQTKAKKSDTTDKIATAEELVSLRDIRGDEPSRTPRAVGFRLLCTKFAAVVELLMGGIPDRSVFNHRDLRNALRPYLKIVDAVRAGNLDEFKLVIERYADLFERDGTAFLIRRLHGNVIRSGLGLISRAYSVISLEDIATKLGLESAEEAEGVVSRAIQDGAIAAVVDHQLQCVKSKPQRGVYATAEPVAALHKRITFCLQMHNAAVEAMQFPGGSKKPGDPGDGSSTRKDLEAQLARAENEDDADFL